jgi:hypothetical protein
MSYEHSIATYAAGVVGLQTLTVLGITTPLDSFTPYSIELPLGNGGVAGQGWSFCEWHWTVLKMAQRNVLRTYCPGKSSLVYIRTLDENEVWKNYLARMIWQSGSPSVSASRALDLTIVFRRLIEQV